MDTARLPNLFLDEESSDVQLHIYTNTEDSEAVVPAHSLVLRTAGEVFRTLLDNADRKEDRRTDVLLVVKRDLQDAIRFLRYLYTRELEDLELNAYISLLRNAHCYDLDDLSRLCNERIAKKLIPLTVCRTYRSLKNLATDSLLAHCKSLMIDCAFLIFWKNLHLTLDEQTMLSLFESDRLNFLDKEQALSAIKRWGCAHRAFDVSKGKDQYITNLLTQMEKSVALNDSSWLLGVWKQVVHYSESSHMLKQYAFSAETFDLWKYWSSGQANPFTIRTEPRLKNKITKFAEVFNFNEDTSSSVKLTGKRTTLMNISVKYNVMLAGFTIRVNGSLEALSGKREVRESMRFLLNDKDLLVNNYKISHVRNVSHKNAEMKSENLTVSNLKIYLRTPVFLPKANVNILAVDFEPRPLFSTSLTAYTFPEDSILNSDSTGLFSKLDERVTVGQLYYFV